MITPRPSPDDFTPKPGFPMRPFFGIDPVLVDDKVTYNVSTVPPPSLDLGASWAVSSGGGGKSTGDTWC